MQTLTLYHGSSTIVEHPQFGLGRAHNDYGRGFYCTEHLELAKEWACSDAGQDGFANEYRIDIDGLQILDLSAQPYCILHWMALLLGNRIFDTSTAVAFQGKQYLLEHFSVNTDAFDLVKGYRADDCYFSFARAFLANTLSVEQLARAMRLGELGEQVVVMSEQAFERLCFVRAFEAQSEKYFPLRKKRDDKARSTYKSELGKESLEGLFLRDIIIEEIGAGDARL